MPIIRTYGCESCGHLMEVELRSDQWEQLPPDCPRCSAGTYQQFKVPAIGGSVHTRAADLALDIAERDYGVADIKIDGKGIGSVPQVRYKDQGSAAPSQWGGVNQEMLEGAIALGRQNRLQHGSGLDVLQHNLKTGAQPDLIEISKKRSMRVF